MDEMDQTDAPDEGKHEHEKQLCRALQEALTAGEHAQLSVGHLDQVGALLLSDGAPSAILAWHGGDVVAADDHVQALAADLVVLQARAKESRRKAHNVGKLAEKLQYGMDKLYGPLRERAEEERQRRRSRQQPLFEGAPAGDEPDAKPKKGGRRRGR